MTDFEKWVNELQSEIDKLRRKVSNSGGGGEVKEWKLLAYNSSGFPTSTSPVYTCGEGESLSDYSEFLVLCTMAARPSDNISVGRAISKIIPASGYRLLSEIETGNATPFSAYANFTDYISYYSSRFGFKFDYEHGTITQNDAASDTGTVNMRLIGIFAR